MNDFAVGAAPPGAAVHNATEADLEAVVGKHVMIAVVDADNAASIRLHGRLGFTRAGRLCEVGYKFDRWLYLVFLQRSI